MIFQKNPISLGKQYKSINIITTKNYQNQMK